MAIKGITIEFRGDTTSLDKALRKVDSETRSIDKELRQVNNALKFNPRNVDLLRQKQELLTKKIAETKEKLELLKDTQAKVDSGEIEMSADDYRKLQREIIEAESKLNTFNGQLKKVDNTIRGMDMQAVSDKFKSLGDNLTKAGEAMKPVSAAAAALVASLGAVAYKAGAAADDLNTLSKVTGIGTGDLQKYSAAADLVDVSVETIAKSNQKLRKNMYSAANGSKSQAEAFKALGVSVTDANGELRDGDEVFQDVITALGGMTNEVERDAIAQKLMGKSATELNPLIEDGGKTYKDVADTLKKYDLDYIDQETLDKANEFNDSLDMMKVIGSVALQNVGSQLAGVLAPALEKIVDLFGRFAEWLGNLNPKVLAVVGVVAAVIAGVAPLLLILGKLAFAISSITGLMATAGLSFGAIAGPIGIAIAAIAAIIAVGVLLYKNWDKIKATALKLFNTLKSTWNKLKTDTINKFNAIKASISNIWNTIKTKVSTVANSIKTTLSNAWGTIKATASTAWNAIKEKITHPIEKAKEKVKSIIDKLKSLFPISIGNILSNVKTPHFDLEWSSKDFGKLGTIKYPTGLGVSWYAQGGIFDSPSVIGVGEAGSEAVVPLDKFWDKLEKMQVGNTSIVININGANADPKQIADEVKRALIRETNRQRLAWQ